ncbi:lactoylglutathione lyase [Azospirillum cavernae]|uniref:Lactoylglutathione lyase n=1 Tax=Azospirillum cavernae TaxID=2320860 RepID=A0A418W041_9PROT|nr:VOC family protein [Azospirillum cavernae]RJF83372.1 lactoylglutathione lyase [Azospirillum cavernae]
MPNSDHARLDPVARLDHVNVIVRDMDRAVAFYSAVFAMTETLRKTLSGPWFEALLERPGATADCVILVDASKRLRIELLRFPERTGAPDGPQAIGHFAVAVDDIATTRARALAAGAVAVGPIVTVPDSVLPRGKLMCYLRDPDGALFELAQYPQPLPSGV